MIQCQYLILPVILLWICVLLSKSESPKAKSQPWLNKNTCSFRQMWRKAERKWKKDKLQVSYNILKDAMIKYQKAVKAAKTKYFSDLIRKIPNNPKVLFKTIDSVLNPEIVTGLDISQSMCGKFLEFFINKFDIRASILPPDSILDYIIPPSLVHDLNEFKPISLPDLVDLICHMKPTPTSVL